MSVITWLAPLLVSVGAGGYWLWLYLRYGQEPGPDPCPAPVSTPPYDWAPVHVGYLYTRGELLPRDMIATIADLAWRAVISLDAEPVSVLTAGGILGADQEYGYFVSHGSARREPLTNSERYLVEQVLTLGPERDARVSLTDLMIQVARHGAAGYGRFDEWRRLCAAEPQPIPIYDELSLRMSRRAIILGVLLMPACYPLAVLFRSPYSIGLVALGAAMVSGSKAIRRRTQEAVNAFGRWRAYRAHLAGLPDLPNLPIQSIILKGRPLIYAIAFGIARAAIEPFRLLCSDWETVSSSANAYPSALTNRD